MKRDRIIPLTKPGKASCYDASKYRPISLLNVGGKALEKVLVKRLMHFLYRNDLLNQHHFGFSPQKSLETRQWQQRTSQTKDVLKGKL